MKLIKPIPRSAHNLRCFGLITCMIFFSACTTSPEICQELDWFEIGRLDGLKGLQSNQRREVKAQCTDTDASLSEAYYNNGFDSGVSESCTPQNAFELGKQGKKVDSLICPPVQREAFETALENGRRFSRLENEFRETHKQIGLIDERIENADVVTLRRGLLKGEKLELQEKSQKIEKEMTKLTPDQTQRK